MSRRCQPPDQMRDRRVSGEEAGNWNPMTRRVRSCWNCGQTYLDAEDATRCERIHEAEKARNIPHPREKGHNTDDE